MTETDLLSILPEDARGSVFDGVPEPDAEVTAALSGQWRLSRIQLANWGTFDGEIHTIPVSRQGQLITGPSGSGKSSLLDAIASVLTPDKWLRFNVAAQTAGARTEQRSIISYVRGAWTRMTDAEEDRVVSRYLRPHATWSGIVLRFENEIDPPVTLARLFFVKGSGTKNSDVSDLCLLDRSGIDLADLQEYALGGIQTRALKAAHPDAVITSNGAHGRFYARMRSLFDIEHESALQLLHKTQSAKHLDSLDQLFREHMLEPPATFALADTAVDEFGDLKDAHEHVVQLRHQRDHLLDLRDAATRYDTAHAAVAEVRELAASVIPFQKRRELDLLDAERSTLDERIATLDAEADDADRTLRAAADDLKRAERAALELGGSETAFLHEKIRAGEETRRTAKNRWASLRTQLSEAGIDDAPTTAAEFAELQAEIARILDGSEAPAGPSHADHDRFSKARARVAAAEAAITALRRSGTTVPGHLLEVRTMLAEAVGLPESALPFGAELIEVRPEHAAWTGAIERVLRPLALTLLVRSDHLGTVRSWVDSHRITTRLVFEVVPQTAASPRPAKSAISLVNRVRVAETGVGEWVSWALSERYDYACVDHLSEMDDHVKAVTINGQIKTSRTRYEKDDRRRIDDRSQWVLGDRDAKLEALIDELKAAEADLQAVRTIVETAEADVAKANERRGLLAGVRRQTWRDVDADGVQKEIDTLQARLDELMAGDSDLQAANRARDEAETALDDARARADDVSFRLRTARATRDGLAAAAEALREAIAAGEYPEVSAAVSTALEERFRAVRRKITRDILGDVGQAVMTRLQDERDAAADRATGAGQDVTRLAAQFQAAWPSASANLTSDVEDRQGFLDMLAEIQAHGLPEHEGRFLDLLRKRSRDLIGELRGEILGAPREIQDRVDPVNASLQRSEFDTDRFLHLRVKTRRSETVKAFMRDLATISEGSWGDEDLETAEMKYELLADIMRRFASSEHIDRVWRTQCLDTRLHVTFLAEELDRDGTPQATYDSGAAMSGGQQQKLVVFCLAAALRYQLADPDEPVAKYGTIILDEAFDKADSRYTRMALNIFVEFGFHMVLATPQKLLQTIEPYVGAAAAIDNPTRAKSVVANMVWETDGDGAGGKAAGDGAAGTDVSGGADSGAEAGAGAPVLVESGATVGSGGSSEAGESAETVAAAEALSTAEAMTTAEAVPTGDDGDGSR